MKWITLVMFTFISLAATQIESNLNNLINKLIYKREIYNKDSDGQCICVPRSLCSNEVMLSDGKGHLDIRMKYFRTGEEPSINKCKDYLEVCCEKPNYIQNTTQSVPYVSQGCGKRNAEGVTLKITGNFNNEAEFGEFPWMIVLFNKTRGDYGSFQLSYQCGGALIHEKVVLTTAHCVFRKLESPQDLVARAGEWDTKRTNEIYPHQDREVAQIIIHPTFRDNLHWDNFALLILDQPFILRPHIDTVCLPSPGGTVSLGRKCYASGWGKDKFGELGRYQQILKKIELPIVTTDQCATLLHKTRVGPNFKLHESYVCAGGNGKDTCTGDGGSPFVCPIEDKPGTYELTGLVSWGIGCGGETPGVYAGVSYARNWIDKTLGDFGYTIGAIDPRY